jgi:gelsolin
MMDIKFEDSNLFNFGTELELKVKKAAAEKEEEWTHITDEPGILIWRIEKFHVKKWPKNDYGQFYDGDSYIILITTKDENDRIEREAHMWVGNHTTADESGTAAYKIVELDTFFDRNVTLVWNGQGNETQSLKEALKNIRILKGGIESGFNKVTLEIRPTELFEVFNKRIIQVDVDGSSLNSYNCFVLDHNDVVYKWKGKNSTNIENFGAACLAKDLRINRSKVEYLEIDQDHEDERFWKLLGGKKEIKDEQKITKQFSDIKKMLKISDNSGELQIEEISYDKANLDSNEIFMIRNKDLLVIWVGNKSSRNEKKECMKIGQQYLNANNIAKNMKFYSINEGNSKKLLDSMFL